MSEAPKWTARYNKDGHLELVHIEPGDSPEPICSACGEPIKWCLDMFSFATGFDEHPFTLQHARCAWTPSGFTAQRRLAAKLQRKRGTA